MKLHRPDMFRMVFSIVAIVMVIDFVGLLVALWNIGVVAFLAELIPLSLQFTLFKVASVVGGYLVFVWLVSLAKRFRKKDTRVFVSFQHKHEDTASEVATAIERHDLTPAILAFETRDRDDVIRSVVDDIRASDALVVVAADEPGFFEAEVLAAATMTKPVIVVVHGQTVRVPNTAYTGYPVFDLDSLRAHDYEPLSRLLHYVAADRSSLDYCREGAERQTFARVLAFFVAAILLYQVLGHTLFYAAFLTYGTEGLLPRLFGIARMLITVISLMMFITLLVEFVRVFLRNRKLIALVAQKTLTRRMTNATLKDTLSSMADRSQIVTCLWTPGRRI